jgi:hypothetical protein
MHVVLGNPVIDLAEVSEVNAYRVHLGLAFQLR